MELWREGTNNTICVLSTQLERAIEVKTDRYLLCFIDYLETFDSVEHKKIIKLLEQLNMDGRSLQIIKNTH